MIIHHVYFLLFFLILKKEILQSLIVIYNSRIFFPSLLLITTLDTSLANISHTFYSTRTKMDRKFVFTFSFLLFVTDQSWQTEEELLPTFVSRDVAIEFVFFFNFLLGYSNKDISHTQTYTYTKEICFHFDVVSELLLIIFDYVNIHSFFFVKLPLNYFRTLLVILLFYFFLFFVW